MDERRRAFYEYHAAMLEPGTARLHRVHRRPPDRRHAGPQRPAAFALRHRRRPGHHGPESGVLPMPENKIVRKWRLQPGKMFLIDWNRAA